MMFQFILIDFNTHHGEKLIERCNLDEEFFLQNIKSKKDVLIRDYIHLSKWNKFYNKK